MLARFQCLFLFVVLCLPQLYLTTIDSRIQILSYLYIVFHKSTQIENDPKKYRWQIIIYLTFRPLPHDKICLVHSPNITFLLFISPCFLSLNTVIELFYLLRSSPSKAYCVGFLSKAPHFQFSRKFIIDSSIQQKGTISNQINLSHNNFMSNQLQTLLCSTFFAALGFQPAQKTNIPALLKRINPDGGTAMRDSLIEGCKLMLKLNQALKQMESDSHWNFVHVILTDGADCNSKNSLQDAAKMMVLIGKLIEVKTLKIIIIGVGVEDQAEKELRFLAAVGGENAEYYNVNSSDIGNIFNKIEIGLGLQQNLRMMGVTSSQGTGVFLKREVNPYLQIKIKNFAVMFNLDVSGSMSGNKWTNVCSSVSSFISKLGESDLVSGLVFNDQVRMLSNIKEDDKLINRPRAVSNSSKTTNATSASTQKTNNVQHVQGRSKNIQECEHM